MKKTTKLVTQISVEEIKGTCPKCGGPLELRGKVEAWNPELIASSVASDWAVANSAGSPIQNKSHAGQYGNLYVSSFEGVPSRLMAMEIELEVMLVPLEGIPKRVKCVKEFGLEFKRHSPESLVVTDVGVNVNGTTYFGIWKVFFTLHQKKEE